jgi:NADPH2:quinone reductase
MASTVKAIQIAAPGGPEVMKLVELPLGDPGPGEVRVRHHACGLNYIDVYHRTGLYGLPMPLTLGMEAAGVVEAVGSEVTHLRPGDRCAYASQPPGAYSEARVLPAKCVVRLPDAIDFETGAAMMLKGLTAQYLLKRTLPQGGLQPGDYVLFEKCAIARQHGAAHAINYRSEDFVARVKEITGGKGVKVVYDGVGRDTFERSLDCLRPFGLMASYGNASGPVAPLNIGTLGAKGSLYVTRPTLFTHIATRESTQAMADDLFAVVSSGQVRIPVERRYALADVAQAHRDLEARATVGCSVLLP